MVAAGSRIATLWSSITEGTGRDTVPELGSAVPLASLRKVDLPAPFGPVSATRSGPVMAKSTCVKSLSPSA